MLLVCSGLAIALLSPQAFALDNTYLAQLIQATNDKQLAQRTEWHKLLHYKPTLLPGGYKSQVDAPRFFIAHDGKTNPQAELDATLTAFFRPFPEDREQQHLHPQCQFIARYHWLKQELNFDSKRLPEHRCWRFEEWMNAINPKGVTLIFPSAQINGPASMFGHTLLRIDAQGQNEQTRLLAYAINFGANTGNDGGLLFAVKGLLGGYPGSFSVLPYYLKVREYNDMENRDIWEYQLNLSEEETRTMLLHAWELRGIWFDYYFFDENCSYHLLSLIETARPDLQLSDQFGAWVIPTDTVRVVNSANLIDKIVYRPSRHTLLEYRLEKVDQADAPVIQQLARNEITTTDTAISSMPITKQATALELAHELADYRNDKDESHLHQLLKARSTLGVVSPRVVVPAGTRPDQGHGTGRSSLIVGREAQHNYQELQLRPAYHDLLDPVPGYTDGAQIAFFDLALRHDSQSGTSRIQSFMPVDIVSLTPVSDISTPISWQFNFGLTRKQGQRHDQMLATINGGVGRSWSLAKYNTFYALVNLSLDANKKEWREGYAAGGGISVGLLAHPSERWAVHFLAQTTGYSAGEAHNEKNIGLEQRYTLTQTDTLRMSWSRQRQLGTEYNNFNLSWQRFF